MSVLSELGRDSLRRVRNKFLRKQIKRPLREYSFVSEAVTPKPNELTEWDGRTITWIVPPFRAGSGGHTTIFRFVSLLAASGYKSQIAVMAGDHFGGRRYFERLLSDDYQGLNVPVYTDLSECPVSGITVATSWLTAYLLKNYNAVTKAVYFVQDFEPWFYAHGTDYHLAEETYKFGFYGLTAGLWLKDTLMADYGMECSAFSFSYDDHVYAHSKKEIFPLRKIFFYARPSTARRAFDFGLLILRKVMSVTRDVEIIFAGEDISDYEIPFRHTSYGVLTPVGLSGIYKECSLALVLSFSNVSLLPLEIMACGTPVVSNGGAWVDWLLSNDICVVCDSDVDNIARAISDLLADEDRLRQLSIRGLEFARSTSWGAEAQRIATCFDDILLSRGAVTDIEMPA